MNAPIALAEPHVVRFTIDDFLALEASGVLERYAKTELIDGEIIVLNAQFSEHFTVKTRLLRRLADACDALGRGIEAWSEGAVAIPPDNMPEPDLFITNKTPVVGPVPSETVLLVVEVAATSQAYDFGKKSSLYASSSIPEYWVVDVAGKRVHRFWSPASRRYACEDSCAIGSTVRSATIPGLKIATEGL